MAMNATIIFESSQTFASGLVSKTTELKRERKRCDRLLCQMLPKAVVRQLKQKKQVRRLYFAFLRSFDIAV